MAGIVDNIAEKATGMWDSFKGNIASTNDKYMSGDKSSPVIKTAGILGGMALAFKMGGGFSAGGSILAIMALGGLLAAYPATLAAELIQNGIAKIRGVDGPEKAPELEVSQVPTRQTETSRDTTDQDVSKIFSGDITLRNVGDAEEADALKLKTQDGLPISGDVDNEISIGGGK